MLWRGDIEQTSCLQILSKAWELCSYSSQGKQAQNRADWRVQLDRWEEYYDKIYQRIQIFEVGW